MKKKILNAANAKDAQILRQVSRKTDIKQLDPQIISDMFDSMRETKGIGLSAIQIGIPQRIIIAEYKEVSPPVPRTVLINPEITWFSKKEVFDEEGCLSIPDIYGMVRRPEKIKFRGLNELGEKIEGKTGGLLARIIQHEIDHLNGILFVDRVEGDLYSYEKRKNPRSKRNG